MSIFTQELDSSTIITKRERERERQAHAVSDRCLTVNNGRRTKRMKCTLCGGMYEEN